MENGPDDDQIFLRLPGSRASPREMSNFSVVFEPNSTLRRRLFMINTTSSNDFELYTDSSPAQEVKTQQGREITDIYIL